MILVEEAEKIILSRVKHFGTESISFENALNRVLAEDLFTDRELPPFNRATLDGIAIQYASLRKGIDTFHVKAVQAAGDASVDINAEEECIEIMTGAAVSFTADTVIGYEDIEIKDSIAIVKNKAIKKGQGIHGKGTDKKKNEIIIKAGEVITPIIISIAASVGKTGLMVKKLPKIVVISSGDELVEVHETPNSYQIRRSNSYLITKALEKFALKADAWHIPDDLEITKQKIGLALNNYEVIIITGGISMGKFDYIPKALEALGVQQLFYKVKQRPGKPFWFGEHANGAVIFALPGNPVSTFMCWNRYVLPWLQSSLTIPVQKRYAMLQQNVSFNFPLQYFVQVKLSLDDKGQLWAIPFEGNGSGDFANLAEAHAFMELPLEQNNFSKGEVFPVWPFKEIF